MNLHFHRATGENNLLCNQCGNPCYSPWGRLDFFQTEGKEKIICLQKLTNMDFLVASDNLAMCYICGRRCAQNKQIKYPVHKKKRQIVRSCSLESYFLLPHPWIRIGENQDATLTQWQNPHPLLTPIKDTTRCPAKQDIISANHWSFLPSVHLKHSYYFKGFALFAGKGIYLFCWFKL